MMPEYHLGTLDEASQKALAAGGDSGEADPARAVFLQSKVWTKAILSEKRAVSSDSKIFTFTLDHPEQRIGLPVGEHLMMRLRDPATREAIIRAYTPISEVTDKGKLDVLIKVYRDTPEQKGGRMTQALDSIPVGHFVDFKGPVGKFEYLGKGVCSVSGQERRVKRFIMVCGGSGVTPIFQVLRAVMKDPEDATRCVVLDGNRNEEDILCREELDSLAAMSAEKCRLLYSLTKAPETWKGLRGRMDAALFEKEVGPPGSGSGGGDEMVLICGPEAMEKSAKSILLGLGWSENDLLFF